MEASDVSAQKKTVPKDGQVRSGGDKVQVGRTAKLSCPKPFVPRTTGSEPAGALSQKFLSAAETVDRNDRGYAPFDAPAEDGAIIDDDMIGSIGISWRHTRTPCYNPHHCSCFGGCRSGEIYVGHQTNPVIRFRVHEATMPNPA
jgi:hypothetical protein